MRETREKKTPIERADEVENEKGSDAPRRGSYAYICIRYNDSRRWKKGVGSARAPGPPAAAVTTATGRRSLAIPASARVYLLPRVRAICPFWKSRDPFPGVRRGVRFFFFPYLFFAFRPAGARFNAHPPPPHTLHPMLALTTYAGAVHAYGVTTARRGQWRSVRDTVLSTFI